MSVSYRTVAYATSSYSPAHAPFFVCALTSLRSLCCLDRPLPRSLTYVWPSLRAVELCSLADSLCLLVCLLALLCLSSIAWLVGQLFCGSVGWLIGCFFKTELRGLLKEFDETIAEKQELIEREQDLLAQMQVSSRYFFVYGDGVTREGWC